MAGLRDKKVIVTGGTGFIGSHLTKKLCDLGMKVVVLDIKLDSDSFFIKNQLHKKATLEISDVRIKEDVSSLYNKYKPDFVVHLAAQTLVTKGYLTPVETLETNINGTINILDEARRFSGIQSVIVASSDKAYGKSDKTYNESFPLSGDHPYDVSKSSADLICTAYFRTYKTPVVITRFGNVYGEGDLHFDRIIPGICKSIIFNEVLEIRSNGKYIRDYLYVDDVVNGYLKLLLNSRKIQGEAYNFSSNESLSVLDLIDKISKILGKKIKYKIINNVKNEIPRQHLDDSKIKKLGWKNSYQIESTIKNIVDWYKKYYNVEQ